MEAPIGTFPELWKINFDFQISKFPELGTGIWKFLELSSCESQLCWEPLDSFSYYRVFDSQNLSLKFGFQIHTFVRICTFWDPESLRRLSEQNRNLGFQSSNRNFLIPADIYRKVRSLCIAFCIWPKECFDAAAPAHRAVIRDRD